MTPSQQIDQQILELNDWRGALMAELRQLVHQLEPNIIEEWKWGTPIFNSKGMVVALAAFKNHVKLNFFKGAFLEDPDNLFNAGLEAKTSRGIDFSEKDQIDKKALERLIKSALEYNK